MKRKAQGGGSSARVKVTKLRDTPRKGGKRKSLGRGRGSYVEGGDRKGGESRWLGERGEWSWVSRGTLLVTELCEPVTGLERG